MGESGPLNQAVKQVDRPFRCHSFMFHNTLESFQTFRNIARQNKVPPSFLHPDSPVVNTCSICPIVLSWVPVCGLVQPLHHHPTQPPIPLTSSPNALPSSPGMHVMFSRPLGLLIY